MKSTMIYLVHLPLILCACLAAGCAADADNDAIWYDDGEAENDAIWYDDGESTCFTKDESGAPVEVPCDPIGGCQTPDDCGSPEIN